MTTPISSLFNLALDLIYPPRCLVCGRDGAFICNGCRDELPRADGRRCERCWLPLGDVECQTCRLRPLSLARLRSGFRYVGGARKLVHELKFRGVSAVAPSMSELLVETLGGADFDADGVVPVPLSSARQRDRGFNQASLLARGVSEHLGLDVLDALQRTRATPPQAQRASRQERRHNVEGAFAVRRGVSVAGRRLLLIDDVATTGATLDACARTLLDAGATSVSGLTFARED